MAEEPSFPFTIESLIENTDDAYTFPPFATFAPLIELNGRSYAQLREHELDLLEDSVRNARRSRVRVVGHTWSEIVPILLDQPPGVLPPSVLEVAARPDDVHAPAGPVAVMQPGNGTGAARPSCPGAGATGGRSRGEGELVELPDRLRLLADLVPMLEAPDADFGHWVVPAARDGVQSLGWFEFGPAGEAAAFGAA